MKTPTVMPFDKDKKKLEKQRTIRKDEEIEKNKGQDQKPA